MVQNVSNNNHITPTNVQGFGNSNSKIEAGHFVVCPPQKIYKYSIYDEFELGKDRYKELLSVIEPKLVQKSRKKSKVNNFIKKIVKMALATATVILVYKKRTTIKNFFVNIFDKIKLNKK